MKRFLILVSAHLFLFLLVIAYQAQAEEEWTIDQFNSLAYARVSGEVTHGDSLNFFISTESNCTKVYNNFTFYTYEKPGDIKQLIDRNIPIKINGVDGTANVITVSPFLMGYRVSFNLGTFPVKEYMHFLKEFYDEFQKYEIEIVDGIDFKAAKYFDITTNNWKLDKLVPSVLEANKLCKTINHLDS
jgi:hypothetical protein